MAIIANIQIMPGAWLDACIVKGQFGIHAAPRELTPLLAAELLARNPDNRPASAKRVKIYAGDMAAGRWVENGEPIIVSRCGLLNDGGHRCAAVFASGITIPALFVFGVERASRTTTNQGRAKGAGDYLGMRGIPNAMSTAGIARLLVAYETQANLNRLADIANSQVVAYFDDHMPEIIESAHFAARYANRLKIVAPAVFGFCYHICRQINQAAAEEYFHTLATGEMLASDDPAFVIRNRLLALGKAARTVKAELILHGWNSFRRGQKRMLAKTTGQFPPLV